MSDLSPRLAKALEGLKALSRDQQDEIAEIIEVVGKPEPSAYVLSDAERADLTAAREEVRREEFATDEEVEATFVRQRP